MQWHVEQAARAGADERQVLEAVEVAMEMGGDAVLRASRSGRCEVTRSPPWQAPGGPPRGWGAERLGAGVGVDAAGSRVSGQR
ncbi:MAG TPA: hypothetical protein VKP11_04125, partial [Frankiaceae bacterium]|nr:hypothetical protein [Frankiaceae bacterium]